MTSSIHSTKNSYVQFRAIIPKPIIIKNMSREIEVACEKMAVRMGKDLENVSKTWKGEKPHIRTNVAFAPSGKSEFHSAYTVSAWPRNDGSKGYWKYVWLDLGTKARYAVMTKGFIPKTRSGQLNSWKGKGGMLWILSKKKGQKPLPGIKARKFTKALRVKWEKPTMFRRHIGAAMKRAAKASGHGA